MSRLPTPLDAPTVAAGHQLSCDDRGRAALAAGLVASAAFVLYLATLAPSIAWSHDGADSGDLVAAAYTLGVPHPTGYPLFMLLAHLATYLPTGDPARSVNLLDALFGAVAAGLTAWIAAELARPGWRTPAAIAAGAAIATTPLFWSQAIIAEVYALAALLFAAVLAALTRWRWEWPGPRAHRWLVLASLLYGLALAHHLTAALLAPVLAIVVVATAGRAVWRPSFWLKPGLALLPGLALYAYLPWRAAAHPPVNWGAADTWDGFIETVTARMYRQFSFRWDALLRTETYEGLGALLTSQLTLPVLLIALWGVVSIGARDRVWAIFLALVALTVAVGRLTYLANYVDAYYLPLLLMLAIWIGVGLSDVGARVGRRKRRVVYLSLVPAVLALTVARVAAHYGDLDVSGETRPRAYGIATLTAMPPSAVLLTQRDEYAFSLWYAQYVLGVRPDVAIVDTWLFGTPWYDAHLARTYPDLPVGDLGDVAGSKPIELIRQSLGARPVVLGDPLMVPLLRLYFDVEPLDDGLMRVVRDRREGAG